jgi:hypothetical protein
LSDRHEATVVAKCAVDWIVLEDVTLAWLASAVESLRDCMPDCVCNRRRKGITDLAVYRCLAARKPPTPFISPALNSCNHLACELRAYFENIAWFRCMVCDTQGIDT